jgi:AcrR family transcriptional regulator
MRRGDALTLLPGAEETIICLSKYSNSSFYLRICSTLSSQNRKPLPPQREAGRQRVAELMEAAAAVIQERGFEAATMAEIAARADAKIGSLYRFFPSKDAVADALMQYYAEVLKAEYDAVHARAAVATPEELADILIDLLARHYPQTRAITALLDSRTDWTAIRRRFRSVTLAGIKTALQACAPGLDGREAEDIAAVVLNNMKTMVGMTMKDAPTSPGAPDELRLMNRLYLAARLRPVRLAGGAGPPRNNSA